jgi:hypothetical protein
MSGNRDTIILASAHTPLAEHVQPLLQLPEQTAFQITARCRALLSGGRSVALLSTGRTRRSTLLFQGSKPLSPLTILWLGVRQTLIDFQRPIKEALLDIQTG